jgi:hypothetical protein
MNGPIAKDVHARALEAVNRFFRCADDGLVLVEAGIEDDRNAGFAAEGIDQVVVHRVLFASHGLQAPGVIHVIHRA